MGKVIQWELCKRFHYIDEWYMHKLWSLKIRNIKYQEGYIYFETILIDFISKLVIWKAVITGDTVTRLSIPIRGRGKSPEEGQRWNLAET